MINFQVSLNYDPVKEVLKIRHLIYILIKKVIILRKLHVTSTHVITSLYLSIQHSSSILVYNQDL